MTINEMMNNPELLADITEDLEDFDETTEVVYEVWALGYDENDEILGGSDDIDVDNYNFKVSCSLQKGKTYYFYQISHLQIL